MRFVPIKSIVEQQGILALHRVRALLVRQRTFHEIGDRRLRQHHQTAGAKALQSSEEISPVIERASPHSAEPAMRTTSRRRRAGRPAVHVAELAVSGAVAVAVSMKAVITHGEG